MTKEIISRVKELLKSDDDEMIHLARVLFWMNSPSYDDLVEACPATKSMLDRRQFEDHMKHNIKSLEEGKFDV